MTLSKLFYQEIGIFNFLGLRLLGQQLALSECFINIIQITLLILFCRAHTPLVALTLDLPTQARKTLGRGYMTGGSHDS